MKPNVLLMSIFKSIGIEYSYEDDDIRIIKKNLTYKNYSTNEKGEYEVEFVYITDSPNHDAILQLGYKNKQGKEEWEFRQSYMMKAANKHAIVFIEEAEWKEICHQARIEC